MKPRCKLSDWASGLATETVAKLLNGGRVELYSGQMPASPEERISTQTRLVRIPLHDPAFAEITEGEAMAKTAWESEPADGSGTVTWFRAYSEGGRAVMDGTVGQGEGDINLNDPSVKKGTQVVVRGFRFRAG